MFHWLAEFQRWGFPSDRVDVVHSSNRDQRFNPFDLDLIISTTHGFVDAPLFHRAENVKGIVIDEASCLKREETRLSMVIHAVAPTLNLRIALSATPSDNTLLNFKCIMDFVQPGLLGDSTTFKDEISDIVRRGTRSTATPPEIAVATSRAKMLYDLVGPHFLRRTSAGGNRIKTKSEIVLWTTMKERQQALYDRVDSEVKHDKETQGSKFGRQHELFSVLNGSHPECKDMPIAKLSVVRKLLKQFVVKSDERMGIFFKYKALLHRTEKLLTKKGIKFVSIHGGTNAKKRQANIDAMNDPESDVRVLLSTSRTTSMGINLFLTPKLVVLEPSYNASVDAQAAARASRPGSIHEVQVYRILTSNTIESSVYSISLQKSTQSRLLLDDRDEVADDVRQTRIENVSMAESIFGKEFDVKSHDATIRNLAIHFEPV